MAESSNAALITFVAYTMAVFLLAMFSNRAAKGKEFVGVLLMLGLALWQVGGLENATRQMARMIPPEHGTGIVSVETAADHPRAIPKGTWIEQSGDVYRLAEIASIPADALSSRPVAILRITTPFEVEKIAAQIDPRETQAGRLAIEVTDRKPYRYGAGQTGCYVANPFVWDIAGSTLACLVVLGIGPPADPQIEAKFFDRHDSRPHRG